VGHPLDSNDEDNGESDSDSDEVPVASYSCSSPMHDLSRCPILIVYQCRCSFVFLAFARYCDTFDSFHLVFPSPRILGIVDSGVFRVGATARMLCCRIRHTCSSLVSFTDSLCVEVWSSQSLSLASQCNSLVPLPRASAVHIRCRLLQMIGSLTNARDCADWLARAAPNRCNWDQAGSGNPAKFSSFSPLHSLQASRARTAAPTFAASGLQKARARGRPPCKTWTALASRFWV
jgi:hypothetical protein